MFNFKDPNSTELRFSLINGDLSPVKLVNMSSKDLAPSKLRQERLDRQKQVFEEQIVTEKTTVITKSTKGETVLKMDDDESEEKEEEGEELVEEKSNSVKVDWSYGSDEEEEKEEVKKETEVAEETKKLMERVRNNSREGMASYFDQMRKKYKIENV